jgi:hypothetical protein
MVTVYIVKFVGFLIQVDRFVVSLKEETVLHHAIFLSGK